MQINIIFYVLYKMHYLLLGSYLDEPVKVNHMHRMKVTTDQWTGYGPLGKDFTNLVQIPSGKKGSNFPELHRTIWTNTVIGSTVAS